MNEIVPAPDRERAYFSAIETAFIARRGTPFLLSPRDFAIMRCWNDLGIPVEDVLAGIDEAFDRRTDRGSSSRINSLAYCEGAVLESWERRSTARAGSGGGRSDVGVDVDAEIERLRANLDLLGVGDARLTEAARAASRSIEKAVARGLSPPAWEEKLRRLEKRFLSAVEAALTEPEHAALERSIDRAVSGEADRMSADALRRTLAVLRRRWLREKFGTPIFSLLP